MFLLADDLAYRTPDDPELAFVVAICSYATDIAPQCTTFGSARSVAGKRQHPAPFQATAAT